MLEFFYVLLESVFLAFCILLNFCCFSLFCCALSFEKCPKMAFSANFEYLPNSNDSGPLKVTAKIGHFGPVCLANPLAKCPRMTILASENSFWKKLDRFASLHLIEQCEMGLELINAN